MKTTILITLLFCLSLVSCTQESWYEVTKTTKVNCTDKDGAWNYTMPQPTITNETETHFGASEKQIKKYTESLSETKKETIGELIYTIRVTATYREVE